MFYTNFWFGAYEKFGKILGIFLSEGLFETFYQSICYIAIAKRKQRNHGGFKATYSKKYSDFA